MYIKMYMLRWYISVPQFKQWTQANCALPQVKKKQHAPKLVGSVANVQITKQPKWEDFTEVTSLYIGSTPPTQDSSHHQDYLHF